MPGRLLADADALVLDVLRAAQPSIAGRIWVELDAFKALGYPFVQAYRVGGSAVNARFLDRALHQVNVYHDDRKAAVDLAETFRTALLEAWETQYPYPNGSISSYGEQLAPSVTRYLGQPQGETFVPATYLLYLSPPGLFPTAA